MKSKLSDICYYVKGKTNVSNLDNSTYISTENMLPEKGGVTRASALPSVSQTQIYESGDVLVSNIRPYFQKIWHANQSGGCSNDVLVFRANKRVDSNFLYYVISTDNFFEYSMVTSKGTKMPRGDKNAIMEFEVPDFNVNKQKKVAGILGELDEKIKINKEINKNLEQQAQALYYEIFVANADPAWKSGVIEDLGIVTGGSTPSKKCSEYYAETGIPWITPRDLSVDHSKFIYHGENDITEEGLSNSSAIVMPTDTVLFSSRAPIGYIAIAANPLATNQGFKSVVPKTEIGTPFVYFFLKDNISVIERMGSGTTFKEVSGSTMKAVPAFIPDKEALLRLNDFCKPAFAEQQNLEAENKRLAAMRDFLLPKLMSGELDVSSVDL